MTPRVTLICGGLGGARLAPYLAQSGELTVVANVGDDLDLGGLWISPDLDAVLYSLAGVFDHQRGFGIAGDSLRFADLAQGLDLDGWFQLGDQDLGTHVARTRLLRRGRSLSEATAALARAMGVRQRILPATDDELRTVVRDSADELDFQSFHVRERASVAASGVSYRGLHRAAPAPGVLEALRTADLVVIAESSPVASVLPTLQLPGVHQALVETNATRIALSPIVLAVPPRSEVDRKHWKTRARLMQAAGHGHHPAAVAALYRGLVDVFVLDRRDAELRPEVAAAGAPVAIQPADLLDRRPEARASLAQWLTGLAGARRGLTQAHRPVP